MKYNAYNNDPEFKQQLVDLSAKHRDLDQYVTGTYGTGNLGKELFRGCSVGCSIVDVCKLRDVEVTEALLSSHQWLADQLGVPLFLTQLQDTLFEGMSESRRSFWTNEFFDAIRPGADLTGVKPKFLKFILEELLQYVQEDRFVDHKIAMTRILDIINRWIETGVVDVDITKAVEAVKHSHWVSAVRALGPAGNLDSTCSVVCSASLAACEIGTAATRDAPFAISVGGVHSASMAAATSIWSDCEHDNRETAQEEAFDRYADKLLELIKEV